VIGDLRNGHNAECHVADRCVSIFTMHGINMAVEYYVIDQEEDEEGIELHCVWLEGQNVLPLLSDVVLACIHAEIAYRVAA
jgi:hypothetical protein